MLQLAMEGGFPGGLHHDGSGETDDCNAEAAGDPVDCKSGLFVLNRMDTFARGAIPIVITRTYRPGDTISRSFGFGTQLNYAMYLREVSGTPSRYMQYDLVLPTGAAVRFYRTSPGTGYTTVVAVHNTSASAWYGAILNGEDSNYYITKTDGTLYVFSLFGSLTAIKDRFGNQLTVARNGGQITRITAPGGRFIDFTYDGSSRVTQLRDNTNRTWTYEYSNGSLTKITYPDLASEQYGYDGNGNMLTVSDRDARTIVSNEYDVNGRVFRQTLGDNGVFQFAYIADASGNVTQTNVTDPRNYVRVVTYDTHGYKATVTHAYGTSIAQTATFERDATSGLVTAIVDSGDRRTEFLRDYSAGSVVRRTRLAGTPNATIDSATYTPSFNLLSSYTDPRGKVTTLSYDNKGGLIATTDPLANQTTFTSDASGRLTSRTSAVGAKLSYTYNSAGDLQTVRTPLNVALTLPRDALGRRTGLIDSMGRASAVTYDSLGMGRVHAVTDSLNKTTTLEYDNDGRLLSVTDTNSGITQYGYDALGRLTSRTDALNQSEAWTYDLAGNRVTYTDRKHQTTTYQYDALNRPSLVSFADGSTITPTFDNRNHLTQLVDSVSGTITRTYDDFNHLTQEHTPQGTVDYTYDASGRRQTMTVAGQPQVVYAYDDANRVTTITQGSEVVTFGYDNANRRTTVTLPNGVVTTYVFNIGNQLTAIYYRNAGGSIGSITYGYDGNGSRVTRSGGFAAEPQSSQTTAASVFDLNNRQSSWNGASMTYDLNGDPSVNNGASPSQTYIFDVRHRLTNIQQSGSTVATFLYDAFGRRTSKTVNGAATTFLYDGIDAVQEVEGSTVSNVLLGLGVDQRFARDEVAGRGMVRRYFLVDPINSTLALTDAAGSVQQTYAYEPYGEVSAAGGSSNPYQYAGRENDGTGLYYYRARYYSPTLKRFISEDPLGLAAGVNAYNYANNAPLQLADPLGRSPQDVNRLQYGFEMVLNEMNTLGYRDPHSFLNNHERALDNLVDDEESKLMQCSEQNGYMLNRLSDMTIDGTLKMDDRWTFQTVTDANDKPWFVPGHYWGSAQSSNPSDPVIQFDTLGGSFNEPPYWPWVW